MLSNTEPAGVTQRFIRDLFATIDRITYAIMAFLFDVFFNIASQDIINGATVSNLISRMQLIVGVIFIFIFAIHIVQGIVNPDLFTDSSKGTSKVVTKVIISLFLISTMIPLNVSGPEHSWNQYMADQGILFGTMSFFQYKVISSNVLGKLVLGSDVAEFGDPEDTTAENADTGISITAKDGEGEVSSIGNFVATSVAKLFVFPNMTSDATSMDNSQDPNNVHNNAICGNQPIFYCDPDDGCNDGIGRYQWWNVENEASKIFGFVNNECTPEGVDLGWVNLSGSGQFWQFQYLAPLSSVVGVFVILMLLKFSADIAIRVFKLVVLRVLGPIAAISYAAPGENKMFSNWMSSLASAYIEVFLDLSIIYFVILILVSLFTGDLSLGSVFAKGTSLGIVTMIFLMIGLLMFAKSAPAYIRQVLGLPESTSKGFFGNLLGGIGALGAITGGAVSRMIGNAHASAQRSKAAGEDPNIFRQIGAGALGLLTGGIAGGVGAYKADSDSQRLSAGLENVRQGNLLNMRRARTQSTARGRVMDRIDTFLGGGESPLERDNREIAKQEGIADTANDLVAFQQDRAYKLAGKEKFNMQYRGRFVNNTDLEGFLNARQAAEAAGDRTFWYNSQLFDTKSSDTDNFQDELYQKAYDKAKSDQDAYYKANGHYKAEDLWQQVVDKQNSYQVAGGNANVDNIKKVRGSGKGATAAAAKIKNSNEYQEHKINYENNHK